MGKWLHPSQPEYRKYNPDKLPCNPAGGMYSLKHFCITIRKPTPFLNYMLLKCHANALIFIRAVTYTNLLNYCKHKMCCSYLPSVLLKLIYQKKDKLFSLCKICIYHSSVFQSSSDHETLDITVIVMKQLNNQLT